MRHNPRRLTRNFPKMNALPPGTKISKIPPAPLYNNPMKNFTMFLGVFVFLAVNALAADSATVLARILAGKGAITAEELAKVESASSDQRVDVLAALLEQKGLLSGNELALVRGDGAGTAVARFEPAVYTPPLAV